LLGFDVPPETQYAPHPPPPRAQPVRPPRADATDEESSAVDRLCAWEPGYRLARGFLQFPHWLVHGEILALLERAARGLTAVFLVLLRYAAMESRFIYASKARLCAECGLGEDTTLDRYLAILIDGKQWAGRDRRQWTLPPLLEVVPGSTVRWRFQPDGLAALWKIADETLRKRQAREEAAKRAQQKAGRQTAAMRWRTGTDESR
jgi:hypothetical protein